MSLLVAAEEQGDKLSVEEMISSCVLLLVAGHETTRNLIGNGTLALLRHPDALAELQNDPESRIVSAIEELLRYDAHCNAAGGASPKTWSLRAHTSARGSWYF